MNPSTEEVIETFPDYIDAELEGIVAMADATYRTAWRPRSHADQAAAVNKAA